MKSLGKARLFGSIRAFIALWMSGIILSVLALSAALFLTAEKFQTMTGQIFLDSKALEMTHLLKSVILSEHREDLLWRATHDDRHRLQKNIELRKAEQIVRELDIKATSREEASLIDEIKKKYQKLWLATITEPLISIERSKVLADSLLEVIDRYQEQNKTQMEKTIQASRQLDTRVDRWSVVIVLLVGTMVSAGALILIQRIVQPTIELSHAASKFGQGDFSARAAILREDELGALCRTFNNMAEDIACWEKNRLEFVATVAHDIKNPLVIIGAAARRLRSKIMPPDQQSLWLEQMIEEVDRLEDLIHDLMDTVQVETGCLSLEMKDLDLTAFVRTIQRKQATVISSHMILFEGDEECRILGDERRLYRVVVNLISNAVKYSSEQTPVLLKVERQASNAVLTVQDQGCGILSEDLDVLFQPFGRLRRTQNMAEGTGLGLFTVKKIIEGHGGTIKVTSELDVGTTIEISLPLV